MQVGRLSGLLRFCSALPERVGSVEPALAECEHLGWLGGGNDLSRYASVGMRAGRNLHVDIAATADVVTPAGAERDVLCLLRLRRRQSPEGADSSDDDAQHCGGGAQHGEDEPPAVPLLGPAVPLLGPAVPFSGPGSPTAVAVRGWRLAVRARRHASTISDADRPKQDKSCPPAREPLNLGVPSPALRVGRRAMVLTTCRTPTSGSLSAPRGSSKASGPSTERLDRLEAAVTEPAAGHDQGGIKVVATRNLPTPTRRQTGPPASGNSEAPSPSTATRRRAASDAPSARSFPPLRVLLVAGCLGGGDGRAFPLDVLPERHDDPALVPLVLGRVGLCSFLSAWHQRSARPVSGLTVQIAVLDRSCRLGVGQPPGRRVRQRQ